MSGTVAFFKASASLPEIGLFLEIDPKNDFIKDLHFDGPKANHYKPEIEELKKLVTDKTLSEVKKIVRTDLSFEVLLENGKKAVAPMGLWLLHKAIANYQGEERFYSEQSDMVCLCFSITKKDIASRVLKNKNFDLKTLIQETMASSACGTCKNPIEDIILETRMSYGLIKGLDHSKSRFDEKDEWLKVAGLYPGELLIRLEELKQNWMNREEITDQFTIEFTDIEGLHLTVEINGLKKPIDDNTTKVLLSAMTDYFKSFLGVLFFLKKKV